MGTFFSAHLKTMFPTDDKSTKIRDKVLTDTAWNYRSMIRGIELVMPVRMHMRQFVTTCFIFSSAFKHIHFSAIRTVFSHNDFERYLKHPSTCQCM